jgi:hypothetical protein
LPDNSPRKCSHGGTGWITEVKRTGGSTLSTVRCDKFSLGSKGHYEKYIPIDCISVIPTPFESTPKRLRTQTTIYHKSHIEKVMAVAITGYARLMGVMDPRLVFIECRLLELQKRSKDNRTEMPLAYSNTMVLFYAKKEAAISWM